MYKLTTYIPNQSLEAVKTALFNAGAGRVGDYAECCWQVKGQGQFRPLQGSTPHIGQQDELEYVEEWRVEMVVLAKHIQAVVQALKQTHPYETPAYDVVKMADF